MNLLLDTHAFIWLVLDPDRLSSPARQQILAPDAEVMASHVSLWEMAIKRGRGRLDALDRPAQEWFEHYVPLSGLRPLPIRLAHLGAVEHLPDHHRDPFDRLLVAQARCEGLTIVTADDQLSRYDVEHLW